jgi:D-alanyl-lipoteichoic acid acyltransferase DltB (MBOAT superfamily)
MALSKKYLILLIIPTLTTYTGAIFLNRLSSIQKKIALIAVVSIDLFDLCLFKYYNFFVSSFAELFRIDSSGYMLKLILPVGISFYTFQAISYIVDVYRSDMKPVRNILDFAIYISFFRQLLSGPIIRAKQFFPQLSYWKTPSYFQVQEAVFLILIGLVKKMVIADSLAPVTDLFFNNISVHEGFITAWTALLAYSFQIYLDFSGYTDIARGSAKLLGFHYPENFLSPYTSYNIADFWRRWHITLSYWFRDYVYIPLGGSRKGQLNTFINLWITMLLCGFWHGASWNFLLWGGYHGTLLVSHRFISKMKKPVFLTNLTTVIFSPSLKISLNFLFVVIGWVFFRNQAFSSSISMLHSMFSINIIGSSLLTGYQVLLIALTIAAIIVNEKIDFKLKILNSPEYIKLSFYTFLFLVVEILGSSQEATQFIYFRF